MRNFWTPRFNMLALVNLFYQQMFTKETDIFPLSTLALTCIDIHQLVINFVSFSSKVPESLCLAVSLLQLQVGCLKVIFSIAIKALLTKTLLLSPFHEGVSLHF